MSENLDPMELLTAVHNYMESGMIRPHPDAPGHSHGFPGHWDTDGSRCEWCATWNRVRECVQGRAGKPAAQGEGEPKIQLDTDRPTGV